MTRNAAKHWVLFPNCSRGSTYASDAPALHEAPNGSTPGPLR
jgi:hypothetical protein